MVDSMCSAAAESQCWLKLLCAVTCVLFPQVQLVSNSQNVLAVDMPADPLPSDTRLIRHPSAHMP